MSHELTIYRGTFIHLPRLEGGLTVSKPKLIRNRGALWVSTLDGRIKGFDWDARDEGSFRELMRVHGWVDVEAQTNGNSDHVKVKIVTSNEERNEFFFPGFIDTHIHAPQYPNAGLFGSTTLLDWLETYTFPVESGFGKTNTTPSNKPEDAPPSALRVYDQVIARTLSHGTTCASYFATVHVPATNALAALAHKRGQRAFIGRVCMDNPSFCPDYYCDASAEESLESTKSTIEYIHTLDPKGVLIKPIVTPRFAPTCSRPSLKALGSLAASYTPPLHIQTHISENENEVALVKELFPECSSYAGVYDNYNLLTERTILAHAVHLTPEERQLIQKQKAKVSHCPASNSALGSGIALVRTMLQEGITVGLGTDVSGGYSSSILEAVRQACLSSRLVGHTTKYVNENPQPDGSEKLSVEESLYLATRGGADVVCMGDDLGGFDNGMIFDAQLIQLGGVCEDVVSLDVSGNGVSGDELSVRGGPVGNVDIFGTETWEEKIQKWVWSGDDRNVKAVWVAGRMVHERV